MIYKSKKIPSKKFKRNKGYKTVKGGMMGRARTAFGSAGSATRRAFGAAGSATRRAFGRIINPERTTFLEVDAFEKGRLLLISDLEGCLENSLSKVKQLTGMCSKDFFDRLELFLKSNTKNKIAFLGDYFDQGPNALSSIFEITKLHKNNIGKVHIILGNRDINKLRLFYEVENNQDNEEATQKNRKPLPKMPALTEFYPALNKAQSMFERLKAILSYSMGAGNALTITGCEDDKEAAAYFLLRCFSSKLAESFFESLPESLKTERDIKKKVEALPNFKEIIESIPYLFEHGQIVKRDKDFNALLSHAGGVSFKYLPDKNYYTKIENDLNAETQMKYYEKLEFVRSKLENEFTETDKEFDLTVFNDPLNCIKTLGLFTSTLLEPTPEYFLLQGLGLKPSGPNKYMSFIESCSINVGCKGPKFNIEKTYLDQLRTMGIKVIAHGHVPHCTNVPIIYKRNDSPIVFIGNDTSNGFRPSDITIDNFPLSYVLGGGVTVGITSITVKGICKSPNIQIKSLKEYEFMVGNWETEDDKERYVSNSSIMPYSMMPMLINKEKCPKIDYKNGNILTFPSCKDENIKFAPAKFEEEKELLTQPSTTEDIPQLRQNGPGSSSQKPSSEVLNPPGQKNSGSGSSSEQLSSEVLNPPGQNNSGSSSEKPKSEKTLLLRTLTAEDEQKNRRFLVHHQIY